MSTPSIWDLNAICLAHVNRFFQAVTDVVASWRDPDEAFLGAVGSVVGNVVWARSEAIAGSQQQEEALALGGALAGSLSDKLFGGKRGRDVALGVVVTHERRLLRCYDELLEQLHGELARDGVQQATPAELNAWVWRRLFPSYAHAASSPELRQQIAARLTSALAGR